MSVIAIIGVVAIVIAAGLYFEPIRSANRFPRLPASPEPMAKVVERPAATPAEVVKVDNPPAGVVDWPGLLTPPEVPAPVEVPKR
jgi:hypothetical protein